MLAERLAELTAKANRNDEMDRVAELIEARQMAGAGPWTVPSAVLEQTDRMIDYARQRLSGTPAVAVREASVSAQGAYGDIELALQNVEWRREVNISWLEFSRWGIQQIILISRLYYIKNPIIRRLIDVCAAYVFARGVEVTASTDAGNDVLKRFFERNKKTLGQNALCDLERRKDYDGNLFHVLFPDTQNTGEVNHRTFDPTEIQEIIFDPQDQDTPWYYRRVWNQRTYDILTGQVRTESLDSWYPAIEYNPENKPQTIADKPVEWSARVLHRKAGAVAKWTFGCPRMYPALDWAKESRRYLEACASYTQAVSQFAIDIETKGGQQALEGLKQQLQTTVGPTSALWDENPPAVQGSTFAHGPGMKMAAVKTRGHGTDPEEVRQFKLMCCMVAGVPETFLADVSTGNLATATSLDRPTETIFLEKQESWREDLVTIARFVLQTSSAAPSGKLREGLGVKLEIRECASRVDIHGRRVYEKFSKDETVLEVRCEFPAIREGDIPQLVAATCQAIDAGYDPKEGERKLGDLLGIEGNDEIIEERYPEGAYKRQNTDPPEPVDPAKAINKAAREVARAAVLPEGVRVHPARTR
jgi:hypothetical protein